MGSGVSWIGLHWSHEVWVTTFRANAEVGPCLWGWSASNNRGNNGNGDEQQEHHHAQFAGSLAPVMLHWPVSLHVCMGAHWWTAGTISSEPLGGRAE